VTIFLWLFTTFRMLPVPGFWWPLTSAIVAITAGAVLCVGLVGLAGSAGLAIGLLVGIMTFRGVALIAIALQARTIDPSTVVGDREWRRISSGNLVF
jgi:hypothetical protein